MRSQMDKKETRTTGNRRAPNAANGQKGSHRTPPGLGKHARRTAVMEKKLQKRLEGKQERKAKVSEAKPAAHISHAKPVQKRGTFEGEKKKREIPDSASLRGKIAQSASPSERMSREKGQLNTN